MVIAFWKFFNCFEWALNNGPFAEIIELKGDDDK